MDAQKPDTWPGNRNMAVPRNTRIKASSGPEYSLSVSRALGILSSFTDESPERGLSELSRAMTLSKGSVSRFLQALERHGYVDRNPRTRLYRPGPEVARVGNLYRGAGKLKQAALPIMQALVQRFGFTSYLSALRRDAMVILCAVEGAGPIRYTIPVGTRLPVHSTATGHAALAHLDERRVVEILRRAGMPADTPHTVTTRAALFRRLAEVCSLEYSINWEERTVGVASVAAPVLREDGSALCILSLGFATSQVKRDQIAKLGSEVRGAAKLLGERLREIGVHDVE